MNNFATQPERILIKGFYHLQKSFRIAVSSRGKYAIVHLFYGPEDFSCVAVVQWLSLLQNFIQLSFRFAMVRISIVLAGNKA